jgi:hypothetical protein
MPANLANPIPLTPDEQRRARRPRVLLSGRLVYGPDSLTVDCVIRDLTPEGARVKLAGSAMLSGPIALIEVGSGMAHACEISWRRLPEIGVRFQSSDDLNQAGPPELAQLRRVWLNARAR